MHDADARARDLLFAARPAWTGILPARDAVGLDGRTLLAAVQEQTGLIEFLALRRDEGVDRTSLSMSPRVYSTPTKDNTAEAYALGDLDGDGNDAYDAHYYAQGGAAHYAIGALMDDGDGDDTLNVNMAPNSMHFGAGHDFSVGLLVNAEGDDHYRFTTLAQGASNCQGIGIFVDNDGSDTYEGTSDRSVGLGNHSTECEAPERTVARSIGLFLDSGGDPDSWTLPVVDRPAPADNTSFGFQMHGTDDEHGGAVDGDGATGFTAGP